MSFSDRLKERREYLRMSRAELAKKLGVTSSAIGNYENGVSSPKEEILYKIFDTLSVEPNYLWQDEIKNTASNFEISYPEREIIKKYRALDKRGKKAVDAILYFEDTWLDQEVELSAVADTGRKKNQKITLRTQKELEEIVNNHLDEYYDASLKDLYPDEYDKLHPKK